MALGCNLRYLPFIKNTQTLFFPSLGYGDSGRIWLGAKEFLYVFLNDSLCGPGAVIGAHSKECLGIGVNPFAPGIIPLTSETGPGSLRNESPANQRCTALTWLTNRVLQCGCWIGFFFCIALKEKIQYSVFFSVQSCYLLKNVLKGLDGTYWTRI